MKNKWLTTRRDLATKLIFQESVADFLQYYYSQTKEEWSSFSYLWLAKEMNVSKSLVIGIFNGTKKITAKTQAPLLKTLKLPKILEEYFEIIISLENSSEKTPSKKVETTLRNLREAYLDSFEEAINVSTAVSDPDFAILFAALGDQENGASVEDILKRIRWSEERVRFLLTEMELKKFVKKVDQTHWKTTKKFISAIATNKDGWLPRLYFSSLDRHKQIALDNFTSKEHLSLTYSFCINPKDFETINSEIKVHMDKLMKKYHDDNGEKIMSLVLGTHFN